ncbi:hypothetical protein BJV74DRAFT_798605 [Russula compacta]|nr:hypothetical protein BJV74DRAFT_156192 [Russula compacta]KAH9977421.1 hypothetical protein BJV74DRAFT_798605 [Russula compacta]
MMLSKSLVFVFAAFAAVSSVAAAPPGHVSGNNGDASNGGPAAVSKAAATATPAHGSGDNGYGGPAAVSKAAATATPVHGSGNNGDANNGGYASPPNPTTVNECDGGSIVCCDVFTTGKDAGSVVSGLLGSFPPLTTYVGLTCTSLVDNQW